MCIFRLKEEDILTWKPFIRFNNSFLGLTAHRTICGPFNLFVAEILSSICSISFTKDLFKLSWIEYQGIASSSMGLSVYLSVDTNIFFIQATRLSSRGLSEISQGTVINLLATDVEKFYNVSLRHNIWSIKKQKKSDMKYLD